MKKNLFPLLMAADGFSGGAIGGGWTPAVKTTPSPAQMAPTPAPDTTPGLAPQMAAAQPLYVPTPVVEAVAPEIERVVHKVAQELANIISAHLLGLLRGLK